MVSTHNISSSPFPYFGSKERLKKSLYQYLPNDIVDLVDVFGGSAAFILGYSNCKIRTYNDLNKELYTFFKVLREQHEKLIYAIETTPHSRLEFHNSLKIDDTDSELEIARKVFVRLTQSFGRSLTSKSWSTTYNHGRDGVSESTQRVLSKCAKLFEVYRAARTIQIENLDYRILLDKYDSPGNFFYFDPPYLASTRSDGVRYQNELCTKAEHLELIERIKSLKTDRWMLSCYDDELYHKELAGFHKINFNVQTNNHRKRIETIYLGGYYNQINKQQTLF